MLGLMNDMTRPMVEIAIPVYNEERDLERSVRMLHAHLDSAAGFSTRITIVDNASTNSTGVIGRHLANTINGVRYMHLDAKGRGRALRAAWMASDAQVVAYMDVDLSTRIDALMPLIMPILSGHADIAIGSRLMHGARVTRSRRRELLSRGYNLLLRSALHVRFRDAQCGFKAIRTQVARDLVPLVRDDGWFFDTELLVLGERAGLRIQEIPVEWTEDPQLAGQYPCDRAHRCARRGQDAARTIAAGTLDASARGAAAEVVVMAAPKRRITIAERDRALRLRRRLTRSLAATSTAAVAALAGLAALTHPGTSAVTAASTSTVTSASASATPSPSSSSSSSSATPSPTSSSSSSLSTGSASAGSSSSASSVSGAS